MTKAFLCEFLHFCERILYVLKYAVKHNVTRTADRFRVSRQGTRRCLKLFEQGLDENEIYLQTDTNCDTEAQRKGRKTASDRCAEILQKDAYVQFGG